MREQGGLELISIETVDGEKLTLKGAWLDFGFSGFGASQVEWQSQTGYKRNGSRVIDYRLKERNFNVIIGETEINDQRYAYWDARAKILDILRPNRGDFNQLIVTHTRLDSDGLPVKRSIRCVYDSGAEFDDLDSDSNQFRVNLALQFMAHNPLWYNPNGANLVLSSSIASDLVFPITFPIVFGSSGSVFDTGVLNYQGTWRSYPTIILTGPYTSASLVNNGTGAQIDLGVQISAGDTRTITLSEEGFSIVDGFGNSAFSELTTDSNLIDFFIPPQSQVISGGEQSITATLLGADSNSGVTIQYNDVYFGI